jgi:hypothetical protein
MQSLYNDWLAPLPKSEAQEKLIKLYHERYHWPLALAVILLVAEMLLPERKKERKERAVPATAPAARPLVAST